MTRALLVRAAILTMAMMPQAAASQTATVSGVVVQSAGGAPINGATVRLTGLPLATTNADGRFTISGIALGRYTATAQAVGYRVNAFAFTVAGDTTLRIALDRVAVRLDTVVVRAGDLTIDGHVRDATTHTRLLDARVTLFPGDRTIGAMSGGFRITEVPRGEVTIVVDGFQHLPREITFTASKDTSLTIDLDIDSVALRMTAVQLKRLEQRSNAVMMVHQALTGDDLRTSGSMSVYEYFKRRVAPMKPPPLDSTADDECIFYDDVRIAPDQLVGIPMETVERIEIYGAQRDMIRVYTTEYVSSLMAERQIPRIVLMPRSPHRSGNRTNRPHAICS